MDKRFEADFARIFDDHKPSCPAQADIERGTQYRAADRDTTLDVPASKWTGATRTAAGIVLAHNFGGNGNA
jgi:hypothetical protein